MFSSLRKLLLIVMGIPFVILGTRFLLDAGQSLLLYSNAESWTPGNAAVVSVEHVTSADQALGNQTVVRYTYQFDGQDREGQYSCIGDECPLPDLHVTMRAAQAENREVAVLVNPERPDQSMLYRNLYMPLFLLRAGSGLFCFVTGSLSVIFGVYLLRGPGSGKEAA